MKKVFTFFAAVLLTASLWAQSPEKMSYQAVIRNSSDALVINTQIGMEINILQGSTSGTVVYTEVQTPSTNANGLVSIEIGGGAGFNTIDWEAGPYFIKTKTDPTGGTSYTITGTSQLLSVPYALYAKNGITAAQANEIIANTAKNSYPAADATKLAGIAAGAQVNVQADWNQATTSADDYIKNKPTIPAAADGSETKITAGTNVTITGAGTTISPYVINASGGGVRYLGEEYLNGIIFYLYIGSDGQQHGLVVSKTETNAQWQSTSSTTNATRSWDGAYNTALMTNSPAKTWVTGLGADWYLPSIDELSILWHNRFHANKGLNDASATLLSNSVYWSSTEVNATNAFGFYFGYGGPDNLNKTGTDSVRAVRAF